MKRKRFIALTLSLTLLALACSGCQKTPEETPAQAGIYTPGTYTGTGTGMGGDVKVEVTFSADAITAVTVGENQ